MTDKINSIKKQLRIPMNQLSFIDLYDISNNTNIQTITEIYNIVTNNIQPNLLHNHPSEDRLKSENQGHIELYILSGATDISNITSIYQRYVKFYGDKLLLSDIFTMENERRYHSVDDIFSLKNVQNATYNMLTERKHGIDVCLNSTDPGMTNDDKNFFTKLKQIEKYPEHNNIEEIAKSCQSLRYGEPHFDENNHECSSNFDENELLPLTINNSEHFDIHQQLPYNERQIVFGHYQDLEKYEKCRNIFTARRMKSGGNRSSCNSLVEWTHLFNTLYTICSQYTKAPFIRFVLPESSIQPHWKLRKVGDGGEESDLFEQGLNNQDLKLAAIIKIDFIEDREKIHPTAVNRDKRGILHLFLFESKTQISDKLHSHYTKIKITDVFGRQTYIDTIFGSNSVTYTEFNQLMCYLNLPTYRNKYHKFTIFFDPHRKQYTPIELDKIGIEKIDYQCIQIITDAVFYEIISTNFQNKYTTRYMNRYEITRNHEYIASNYKLIHYENNYFLIQNKNLPYSLVFVHKNHTFTINRMMYKPFIYNDFATKKYNVLIDSINNKNLYDGYIYCVRNTDKIYVVAKPLDQDIIDYYQLNLCNMSNVSRIAKVSNVSQNGGSTQFRLVSSSEFAECDEFVSSKYYKIFSKKEREYQALFTNDSDIKPITFSFYLNEYEYIAPQNLVAKQYQKYDFLETFEGKVYLKKDALNVKLPNIHITKYVPLSLGGFFFYYEVIHNFHILDNSKNILEIANAPVFLEACNYYQNKHTGKLSDYNLLFLSEYTNLTTDEWKKYLKYFSQFFKMNSHIYDHFIDHDFFKSIPGSTKYDVICSTLAYFDKSIGAILIDHLNIPINFSIVLYALTNLNIGGNFIFYPGQVRTKPIADLILICRKYFKSVELYTPDVQNKYKYSGTIVICTNFTGIDITDIESLSNIFDELIRYDKSLVNKFNVTDKVVYDKYMKDLANPKTYVSSSNPYISSGIQYIKSFVDATHDDYQFIKKYNKQLYILKSLHIDKLLELKQMTQMDQDKKIAHYNQQKLMNAMLYATKYDFEYISYQDKILNNNLQMRIIQDMYSYSEPIIYSFKKHKEIDTIVQIPPLYQELKRKIYMTNFLIDTRNLNQWNYVKKKVRYYTPANKSEHLTSYVEKHYNTGKISQAWLKMYEMIIDLNLIENQSELKTFHLCEAPGNFIAAMIYHINKHTTIKNFDWYAQSLNPEFRDDAKKTAFGDDYGLIAKNKNRWLWGKDNTGDITHRDNIIFYKDYIKNAELVTSDCGVPFEFDAESDTLIKVHFAQLVMILYGLSIGKTFLAKLMIPLVEPIQISMLYLLYQSFDKLYFYKGVVNTYSNEIYVIGKGYRGISDEMKSVLLHTLENFDRKKDLFNNNYPKNFIEQLNYIFQVFVNRYITGFDRQLYYADNSEILSEQHFKEIKKAINDKNIEWVMKYIEFKK